MMRDLEHEGNGTPFGAWLRKQTDLSSAPKAAALSIQDMDYVHYVAHQYMLSKIMLIEEKRYGGKMTEAQRDTMGVVHQMLTAGTKGGLLVDTLRGRRKIDYYGFHVLVLSRTTPDDSEWMTWDGVNIDAEDLKRILRFEVDPRLLADASQKYLKKSA